MKAILAWFCGVCACLGLVLGGSSPVYERLKEDSEVIIWARFSDPKVTSLGGDRSEISFSLSETSVLKGSFTAPLRIVEKWSRSFDRLSGWLENVPNGTWGLFFLRKNASGYTITKIEGEMGALIFPGLGSTRKFVMPDQLIAWLYFCPDTMQCIAVRGLVGEVSVAPWRFANLINEMRPVAKGSDPQAKAARTLLEQLDETNLDPENAAADARELSDSDQINFLMLQWQVAWNGEKWSNFAKLYANGAAAKLARAPDLLPAARGKRGELVSWRLTESSLHAPTGAAKGKFVFSKGGTLEATVNFAKAGDLWLLAPGTLTEELAR